MTVGLAATTLAKVCTGCDRSLALVEFYVRNGSPISRCNDCVAQKNREWRAANPERYQTHGRLNHMKSIGLTELMYAEMLVKQNGLCGICRTDTPGGKGRWHADHDHACCGQKKMCANCFRGLLCYNCNVGLGKFGDSPASLLAAADYLMGK